MTKTIIFDLAGVLLNLDIEKDTAALAAVGLPTYEECLRRPEIEQPMSAYLNGLIGEQQFLTGIRPYCLPSVTDTDILYSMDAVLDEIPVSRLEMLCRLRDSYNVYLLSNLYDTAWDHTLRDIHSKGYTVEQCFDRVFLSQRMHLAKPDPNIYKEVIRQTGITPEQTIYFDDTRANIEAAEKMGFQSVLVPMNNLESVLPDYLL